MGAEKGKGGRNWAAFCRAGAVAFLLDQPQHAPRRMGPQQLWQFAAQAQRLSALLLRAAPHIANHVGRARVRVALSPLLSAAAPSVTRVH